eukprot:gene23329-31660_t
MIISLKKIPSAKIIRRNEIPKDGRVVKTLEPVPGGGYIALVLLDVFRTVVPEKLQLALNASEVRFAKQQVAESVTGQKIGNISPIFTGEVMKTGLVTVIDANLLPGSAAFNTSDGIDEQDFVYAGVGVDGWELKLLLRDLLSAEGNGKVLVSDISTIRSHQEYEAIQKQKGNGKSSSSKAPTTAVNSGPGRANVGKRLRDLAMSSDTDRLRQLLDDCNEDPSMLIDDPTCNSGKTALHLAAWKGSLENVQLLLARGSNINQWSTGSGNYGKTALFYAMTQCRDDVVMELLDKGAWVKIVNNKGQTPRSLAVSHLKEETLRAIERAEQQQAHLEWLNFRATHSDNLAYGDLDPRLNTEEITKLLAPSSSSLDMLSKCVFPTTCESRRDYRLRNYWKQNISTVVQSFDGKGPLPPSEDQSRNFSPTIPRPNPCSGLVELIGVITGRRQMSRTLLFADIMPVDFDGNVLLERAIEEHNGEGSVGGYQVDRFAWKNSSGDDGELNWIQLIVGKTIRNTLGEEAATTICKGVKVGQVVRVQGRLSDQLGAAKASLPSNNSSGAQYKALEMAVHHVEILFDGKKAAFNPQKRSSSPATVHSIDYSQSAAQCISSLEGRVRTDDATVGTERPRSLSSTAASQIIPESNQLPTKDRSISPLLDIPLLPKGEQLSIGEEDPSQPPQFLDLMEVTTLIGLSNLNGLREHEAMAAIVVNDRRGLQLLADIVSAVELDSTAAVVALDCEWKPSGMYDRSDDSEDKKGGDNPVEILQIATRHGLVIIDMQTLAGPTSSPSDRALLNSCLTRILSNSRIMKLGFEIGQDLRKLMASFPELEGLQNVSNVMDVKRLAQTIVRLLATSPSKKQLSDSPPSPPSILTSVTSLTNLCRHLLGKSLNKSQQCSPWHIRPLTIDQVMYAALDAAVLIPIYDLLIQEYNKATTFMSAKKKRAAALPSSRNWRFRNMNLPLHLLNEEGDAYRDDDEFAAVYLRDRMKYLDGLKISIGGGNVKRVCDALVLSQSWDTTDDSPPAVPSQEEYDRIVEDRLNNRRRHTYIRPSLLRSNIDDSQTKAFEDRDLKKESSFQVGNYVGFTREECLRYCYRFQRKTTSGLDAATGADSTGSDSEGVLPVNNVEDKKGLQSSGGYMLLGNTLALFINLLSPGGDSGDRSSAMGSSSKTKSQSTSKAARKYPNEFLDNGRFFTWFVESSRMKTLLYRKDSYPLTTGSNARDDGANQVFLFVRQKRGQYIHCGRCKLIHSEPSYSSSSSSPQRSGMNKLLFELVDYYYFKSNTTTHTSTGVNDDYTTTAATTTTPPDNWNDLQSSPLYSNAISSHIEELHCGTDSTS